MQRSITYFLSFAAVVVAAGLLLKPSAKVALSAHVQSLTTKAGGLAQNARNFFADDQNAAANHGDAAPFLTTSVRPVRMPAVRGESNYGWVQLPAGTPVELLRRDGEHMWVRWEGTVVRIPERAGNDGAVVVLQRHRGA